MKYVKTTGRIRLCQNKVYSFFGIRNLPTNR